MFTHACDRSRTKNEIKEWLLALAADADEVLSLSKADKLAGRFKQGKFDPDLERIIAYSDPTGERAVSPRWEPTRPISERRPGEPTMLGERCAA